MEILGKDVLSIILTHIPYELVEVISSPNPLLQTNINLVRADDLFWKNRAEILFGKQLDLRQTNWRIVYKNLVKALTEPLLPMYRYDPLLYCVKTLDDDGSLNNDYIADTVSVLQEVGYDPSANNNLAIGDATSKGNIKIVKSLLQDPRVDPSANNNAPIINASHYGHIEIVKLLLQDPRVDPSAFKNLAFLSASEQGHIEIVKLLLQDPRVDPSYNFNEAIQIASAKGNTEIVKLLLQDPRVNPSYNFNEAIQIASAKGYTEIVKMLLQDPRVNPSDNGAIISALNHGKAETVNLLLQADVLDKKAIKRKKLSIYIREYIKDTLSGLLAMHFVYKNVNTKHIYKDPTENKDNFISLYYQFLRYLVRTVASMNSSITYLTSLISRKDLNCKMIILESVKNILHYEKNGFIIPPENPYITIFTGYFMLSFNPAYTYNEILTKLKYKDDTIMYLTAKLIGAKIGLKRLIKNGLDVSQQINVKIKNALNINLVNILN